MTFLTDGTAVKFTGIDHTFNVYSTFVEFIDIDYTIIITLVHYNL